MNAKRVIGASLLIIAGLLLIAYYELTFRP